MSKFWKWTKNEKKNILRLDGVISDWKIDEGDSLTTPKEFRQELSRCKGDIEICINSPGGNIFAAAEIYAMLKEHSGKITAKIPAYAASAASVIAMSADVVEISPLAFLCIHNPYVDVFGGEEKDLADGAKFLHDLKESITDIYQDKTKLPRAKISELMDEETCMNARQALQLHFADKLMFEDKEGTTAQMYSARRDINLLFKVYRATQNSAVKSITKNPRSRLMLGCDWRLDNGF